MKKYLIHFILLLFSFPCAFAQGILGDVPLDGRVVTGKLSNGLTYYIMPNKKPENKVEMRLVVNAGSVLEKENQQGLAHFCEHMAFNGSKNFQKNQLVDYLQTAGVKFGAHLNAYTSFDETVYMLSLPTDDEKVVGQGFQILEDWAAHLLFDPAELEKERGVVLEEYRLGLGAQKRMMAEYLPKLLYQSKYAERLPIGKKEVLETFQREDITSFYESWYRPDLMAVIVVGDLDVKLVEEKIKTHFSTLKNPDSPEPRVSTKVPDHGELFITTVTDPEATYGTVQLAFKLDGARDQLGTAEEFQKELSQYLYYTILNDRLNDLAKKPDAAFSNGWAYQGELWVRSKEALQAFGIVSAGRYADALEQITRELVRVRHFGFSQSELERAKMNLKVALERSVKESEKMESDQYAGQLVDHFLTKSPMPGPEWKLAQFDLMSHSLLPDGSSEALVSILKEFNVVITFTGPESDRAKMPVHEEVRRLFNTTLNTIPEPYPELVLPSELMLEKPIPGAITKSEANKTNSSTTLLLENGIRIIYQPTTLKNDEVLFNAISMGGTNLLTNEEYKMVKHGLGIISNTGVGDYSETDIEKILAGKTVRVSPYIGSTSEGFSGQCSPNDLESLLQMLHLYFTKPRMDPEAYRAFVSRQRSFYDNYEANPSGSFRLAWSKWMHNNHPRAFSIPAEEDWAAMDYNKIHQVFTERFSNAADFTFVFVGNIEPESFQSLVATYLGSLQTKVEREQVKDIGYRVRKGTDKLEVKKGSEPKSQVQIVFHGETPYTKADDLNLDIAAEILTIKLIEVLREDMGGVYGTSAGNNFTRLPISSYYFIISFPCGPENVDALIKAALGELKKLANEGPSARDLDKVKQTMIKTLKTDFQSNRFWLSRLIESAYYGDLPNTQDAMVDQVNQVTPEQIKAIVKKYLQGDYLIGVLNPE